MINNNKYKYVCCCCCQINARTALHWFAILTVCGSFVTMYNIMADNVKAAGDYKAYLFIINLIWGFTAFIATLGACLDSYNSLIPYMIMQALQAIACGVSILCTFALIVITSMVKEGRREPSYANLLLPALIGFAISMWGFVVTKRAYRHLKERRTALEMHMSQIPQA